MRYTIRFALLLSVCVVGMLLVSGCQGGDGDSSPTSPSSVLLNQTVTVPGGGGSVDVTFSANSGQTIRITLTVLSTAKQRASHVMIPYGFLEYPDGTGEYQPSLDTAEEGGSMVELTLTQTGVYTLTIMDGSNHGGEVRVHVEVLDAV